MNSILILSILAFVGAGCSRPSGGSAKVVIEMPHSQDKVTTSTSGGGSNSGGSSSGSSSGGSGDDEDEDEDNNIIAPKDLSKLNCYVAAVAGPEENLKRNKCGRKNPIGTAITESSAISIGSWVHGNAGESLELSVTAGSDRVFYIFGAYAKDKATCSNLKNSTDETKLSRFYMLGKSASTTIEGGVDASVAVNISLDRENYIDECKGPDFTMEDKDVVATKVRVVKEQFPANVYVESICQQIKVILTDDLGRPASLPVATTGEITLNIPGVTSAMAPGLYNTSQACTTRNDSGGYISIDKYFTMPANTSEKIFWIAGAADTGASTLKFNVTLGSLAPPTPNPNLIIQPSNVISYAIEGPEKILPDRCHDYTITQKYLSGLRINNPGAPSFPEAIEIKNNSGSKLSFSLASCAYRHASDSSSSIEVALDSAGRGGFSVIAKNISGVSALHMATRVKRSGLSGDIFALTQGLLIQPGSTHPVRLDILNKHALIPTGTCQLAEVTGVNENGTAIGQSLGDTSTTSSPELPLSFTDYSMHLDSDASCANTNMAPKRVSAPAWRKSVYLKKLLLVN